MSKNISRTNNGSFALQLYLTENERKQLKKLANSLGKNDFETIKYCIQLISWWSKNEIEPEIKK